MLTAIIGVLVVAAVFQVFFRYQYEPASGSIFRADRLTGRVCMAAPSDWCDGRPAALGTPNPWSRIGATPCPQQPGEGAVDAFLRCRKLGPL